jgi:hypothetical protein
MHKCSEFLTNFLLLHKNKFYIRGRHLLTAIYEQNMSMWKTNLLFKLLLMSNLQFLQLFAELLQQ